jgi:aryl-alcohol dehydrogenase-like predicted oxidoreductase
VTLVPGTGLDVFDLCLGGNVFGWTADEAESFAVLDAYVEAGGNFVDSADSYSHFAPGNSGGESETIIGRWLAARGNRDEIVIATKVGKFPGLEGTAPAIVRTAVEASLRRLGTDRIDLYYAHMDDEKTPLEETLGILDELVREGLVRHVAASNFTAPRLAEALAVSEREGLARYVALQPHYSLVERGSYEGELADLCVREGLACFPYWGLARGFLTGKYRTGGAPVDSPRASGASSYLNERGLAILAVLDEIAADRRTTVAAVALAWLRTRPGVLAPIASARTTAQLAGILPAATLELSVDDAGRLTAASA